VTDTIAVEVVYALAEKQWLRVLRLAPGSRVRDALEASGLVQELALQEPLHLGVHGRRCAGDTPLITGDRVGSQVWSPARRLRHRGSFSVVNAMIVKYH
jgi:putative ubiquitin-RnfH superfamily antitoxin RatB of RatAB toxin-antitoxin module